MRPDAEKTPPRSAPANLITVRLDRNGRGAWEVATPDQRERVTCETLDDARQVAHLYAAHRRPCELIARDAYHRVPHHEFINGKGDPALTVTGEQEHHDRSRPQCGELPDAARTRGETAPTRDGETASRNVPSDGWGDVIDPNTRRPAS
jgi:hypothetical protein